MKKCFVTNLNGIVSDNSILKVGEFVVKTVPYNDKFPVLGFITLGVDRVEVLDDGYITNKEGTENLGKTKVIDISNEPQISLTASTDKGTTTYLKGARTLKLHSKYDLKRFTGSPFGFNRIGNTCYSYVEDISEFAYSPNLQKVEFDQTYMQVAYNNQEVPYITGDISVFADKTDMQIITIGGINIPKENLLWKCGITGDIKCLSKLTKLYQLSIISGKVTGKVEDLLNGMVANGRKEGTLQISFMNGITYEGKELSDTSISFTFSDSGWSKNT